MRLLRPTITLGQYNQNSPFHIRQRLSSTPGIILIVFSIVYLACFQYYTHANFRDPTSYFFQPSRAYEHVYSAKRIKQADAFIEKAAAVSPPSTAKTASVMCIGIATVTRRTEQYVRKTVGSLLEGLDAAERGDIFLEILIGHSDPSKHPVSHEKWIETLPNKILKYQEKDLALVQTWEEGGWYRNKTIFDYTYLLRDCYDTGAQYIVMVEDDTLAMRGWYPRALRALSEVQKAMRSEHESLNWIYLRIFYAEDLFGWNSEYWPQYLFWSLAIWIVLNMSLVAARRHSKALQASLSNMSILMLSCVCLPAFISLHFMAGRNSVLPLTSGVHKMNKYGCCSQGYIFPRQIVPTLLNLTNLETDWLVDMMVEDIADEQGFVRWATVPALLQHIGTTSSKGRGFDETAKSLWNFQFELHQDTP